MIKIRLLFLISLTFCSALLFAQSDMMVKGTTPELHLIHTVAPKETWYGLGRMYNISPKALSTFNQISVDQPLTIGQTLKIPLTSSNFAQSDAKKSDEVLVPLYHIVQEKEWMYRISVNHNKVPIESLEKWNNISRDNAGAGTKLIVGFLKVKQGQSSLAAAPVENPVTAAPSKPVVKTDPEFSDGRQQTIPRESPKKPAAAEDKPAIVPAVPAASNTTTNPASSINFKGGYFRGQFDQSGQNTSGVSGIFKSTSGWKDGKYYALMNNVPVGTIVKVSFPSNNKSVYAKVLGQLPEMRESQGLTIRLSDAAVSELGAGNTRFTVDVAY